MNTQEITWEVQWLPSTSTVYRGPSTERAFGTFQRLHAESELYQETHGKVRPVFSKPILYANGKAVLV